MKAFGNDLYMLCDDNVRVSHDFGQSWGIPRILSFTTSASGITVGDTATLTWDTVGTTSTSLDQGIGAVAAAGTTTISPATSRVYTLSAIGDTTATATVSLTVYPQPVINSFTINNSNLITWSVLGSSTTTITPTLGNIGLTGSNTVSPVSTTTYTLSAKNALNRTVTSTVTANPTGPWMAIGYGNGTFVAVAYTGGYITSSDGLTWTGGTTISGFYASYNAVVRYLSGKFFAISDGGSGVSMSATGTSWTHPTTLPEGAYTSIAEGGGKLVLVGSTSGGLAGACYSTDGGITWIQGTIGSCYLVDVAYGNGRFVAVASSGNGYSSTNGINWSALTITGNQPSWSSIEYANGRFVAVNGSSGRYTLTSPDGIAWTVTDSGATSYQDQKVIWEGSRFVRLRKQYGTGAALQTSTDGITWSNLTSVSSATLNVTEMAYGASKLVYVAISGELLTY